MSIAANVNTHFNENNPSKADVRDFADSLTRQLLALGYQDKFLTNQDHIDVWKEQNGKFNIFVHNSDNEHLRIRISMDQGSTQIALYPWRTVKEPTSYGSTLSSGTESNLGGKPVTFPWKDRAKAEEFLGAWIINCASPEITKALTAEAGKESIGLPPP